MSSFSRGLVVLGRCGLGALRTPCQPLALSHTPPHTLLFRPRLLPSSPFSSFSPKAAAHRPKHKSKLKPRAAPPALVRLTPVKPAAVSTPTAASAPAPAPARPSLHPTTSAASTAGTIRTFADQLGRRSAPTLLYEAPSQFWFRASCIGAGSFCIGYTLVNYWTIYLRPPPDLVWWVPHAFGLICVVMAGLGGYFILGGARIIRTIQAVPASRIAALAGPGPAAKAANAAGGTLPPILLEVEIGRLLPLLPARKLYVAPGAIALPFRLAAFGIEGTRMDELDGAAANSATSSTGHERVMARRAEEERRKKAREYEMNHLMTAPFRHAWQGAHVAWTGIRRAFSREGFVPVEVDGQKYKLDVSGGWALENGRALDRLATIKEGQLQ